jgi:hypothetical protein
VNDRIAIDLVDAGDDALLELVFRGHPDVAQDRAGEFGEEALDEVEPGAVLGRAGERINPGRQAEACSRGRGRSRIGSWLSDYSPSVSLRSAWNNYPDGKTVRGNIEGNV